MNGIISKTTISAIPSVEHSSGALHATPLVTVLMLAYNHESTIVQAIESIVEQSCKFSFELLIGEDCSTDKTLEICKQYQEKYSQIIRLITSDKNVGMHKNFARLWHRARGKFIAMCEGDDFWIDEKKLDRQVAWMKAHPGYAMCGTYTEIIEKKSKNKWQKCGQIRPAKEKSRYTVADLIPSYSFHFSSILLKKEGIFFPAWFWDVYCVDRPLYLLCAEQGGVGVIPEVMSVYRLHQGGVWSPSAYREKAAKGITLFQHIDAYFEYKYSKLIQKTLGEIMWFYMAESLEQNSRKEAFALLKMSLQYQWPRFSARRVKDIGVVLFRLGLPDLYKRIAGRPGNSCEG